MRNAHCRSWNMAIILKNVENEKCTLQDLGYGKKQSKPWKMKNVQHRIWKMARKLKNKENETHTLQDLEYGTKTDK